MAIKPGFNNWSDPGSEKMKQIEANLDKIGKFNLEGAKSFTVSDISADDFSEWIGEATIAKSEDKMRNLLYFGFQPLYDVLIDARLSNSQRSESLKMIKQVTNISQDYLTGYYTGQPDLKKTIGALGILSVQATQLDGTPYRTKFRNIDYNGISPEHIRMFLENFLTHALDKKIAVPEYVVGCACGSSEIVFPLAGVFGTHSGFVRRSQRRGDDEPVLISEQEPEIMKSTKGKDVTCVEDYVCTSRSLYKVMKRVEQYNPRTIMGAAVNSVGGCEYLRGVVRKRKFHLYVRD